MSGNRPSPESAARQAPAAPPARQSARSANGCAPTQRRSSSTTRGDRRHRGGDARCLNDEPLELTAAELVAGIAIRIVGVSLIIITRLTPETKRSAQIVATDAARSPNLRTHNSLRLRERPYRRIRHHTRPRNQPRHKQPRRRLLRRRRRRHHHLRLRQRDRALLRPSRSARNRPGLARSPQLDACRGRTRSESLRPHTKQHPSPTEGNVIRGIGHCSGGERPEQ